VAAVCARYWRTVLLMIMISLLIFTVLRPDRRPARHAAPSSLIPGDVRRLARPQPAGGPRT
jgi:hypothetical protein